MSRVLSKHAEAADASPVSRRDGHIMDESTTGDGDGDRDRWSTHYCPSVVTQKTHLPTETAFKRIRHYFFVHKTKRDFWKYVRQTLS